MSHAEVKGSGAPLARFWTIVGLLLGVFAWVVGWYWETAVEIAGIWWKSDTFAHGLVVFPIFAWLVWQKREALDQCRPAAAPAVLLAIVLAGVAWLGSELISASGPAHFSLAVILVASFVAVLGRQAARVLAFPLLFLFFGVPIGEFLLPVLMSYTADFTVIALRATGIPVYQEGLYFIIPNGRWSVVEACSGLRYLVASLMIGSLYAYLNYVSLKRRLLFMLVALLVPIVANWIRAYITVRVGYHFGSEFVEGFIHIVYGWVFFGVVILLMFWIGSRWHEEVPARTTAGEHPAPAKPAGWLALAAVGVAVAFFPLMLAQLQGPVVPFTVALEAPPAQPGWTLQGDEANTYRPAFKGHRGEVFQTYRRDDGATVGLYVAYYAEQRKGAELVMHGNGLDGREGSGWARTGTREDQLPVGPVRNAALRRGEQRMELWSWYWINGRVVNSDFIAKGLLAMDRIMGRADDSAVIVIVVPTRELELSGEAVAEGFVRDYGAAISAMLQTAEAAP